MNRNFENINKLSSDCNISTDCRQCKISRSVYARPMFILAYAHPYEYVHPICVM